MLDRLTEGIDFHGKALELRSRRQEVLSSNIANADTPGFKARDFDFAAAMRNAVGPALRGGAEGNGPGGAALPLRVSSQAHVSTAAMARTQPGHIGTAGLGDRVSELSTRMQYVQPQQGTLDGNTVDMDRERAQFADNSIRYEASLRFISGKVRTMLTAIRGE